jgi:hypothetical protein
MTTQKTIYIDWTRHAESCANKASGTFADIDSNPDRDVGYQILKGGVNLSLSALKATYLYEPNLSYIGMQHAINLGINYIQKKYRNNQPYSVVFSSCMTRTIMTTLLAFRRIPNITIYVVPFITENVNIVGKIMEYDNQNQPVDSVTLKKRIALVKDWLEKSWIQDFDDIEVIKYLGATKEIIANFIDEFNVQNYNDKIISLSESIDTNIDNYLQYKPSKFTGTDAPTHDTPTLVFISKLNDDLKTLIGLIGSKDVNRSNIDSMIKFYSDILNPEVRRGPKVDFSLLEYFEKNKFDLTANYDKFFRYVLDGNDDVQKILKHTIKDGDKLFCATHGNILKNYISEHYGKDKEIQDIIKESEPKEAILKGMSHVMNTTVFTEKVRINGSVTHSEITRSYEPEKIRTQYQNFEVLNRDVCLTQSLKGFLNYDMTKEHEDNIVKTIDNIIYDDDVLISKIYGEISPTYGDVAEKIKLRSEELMKEATSSWISYIPFRTQISKDDAVKQAKKELLSRETFDSLKHNSATYNAAFNNLLQKKLTDPNIRGLNEKRWASKGKYMSYITGSNVAADIAPDMKFILEEPTGKYISSNLGNVLKGGKSMNYYQKYVKYKNKYLRLKNK